LELKTDGLPNLTRASRVLIRGGEIVAEASQVTSHHEGGGTGGGISMVADEAITLSSGSQVQIVNSGAGDPGRISLAGGDIRLRDASLVDSQARSNEPGAPLEISGGDVELASGSRLRSLGFVTRAADIAVTAAGDITIDGGGTGTTGVATSVLVGAANDAGSITLQAADAISLASGGLVYSQTSGAAPASNIELVASEIRLDGRQTPQLLTGISSQNQGNATGNSGNVALHADSIEILANSEVSSNTLSRGSGGTVEIKADTLLIDGTAGVDERFTGASSGSNGGATGNAGAVIVDSDVITLLARGAISSDTTAAGNAGSVTVTGSQLLIDGREAFEAFAGITSGSQPGATGNAGAVSVQSDSITILGGGHISSTSAGTSSGTSGGVAVNARSIVIDGTGVPDGYTDIATRTLPGASANAGDIDVQAEEITLRGAGEISSSTFNSGNAGQVGLTADRILIDGNGAPAGLTGVFSGSNRGVSGDAGAVTVRSDQLEIVAGGAIGTNTDGQGDAGDITIMGAAGPAARVSVSGKGSAVTSLSAGLGLDAGAAGRVRVAADTLAVTDGGIVAASTVDGAGGRVELNTKVLRVYAGSRISTSTSGTGNAGSIAVSEVYGPGSSSFAVTISGPGSVVSSDSTAINTGAGAGRAGDVAITAEELTVTDGGQIVATTVDGQSPDGTGGAIRLAVGTLTVDGNAEISTTTTGTGPAGNLLIDGPGAGADARATSIRIAGGGRISAASNSAAAASTELGQPAQSLRLGKAGSIFLTTTDLGLDSGGSIETLATTSAGGDITIDAIGDMSMNQSFITTSAQGLLVGDSGGNIVIGTPRHLILDRSAIRADANAGAGGNVSIAAGTFLPSGDSIVSATSASNVDGDIQIDSVNDLTGTVVEVEMPVLSGPPLLSARCTPQQIENRSSLIVRNTRRGAIALPYIAPGVGAGITASAATLCSNALTAR